MQVLQTLNVIRSAEIVSNSIEEVRKMAFFPFFVFAFFFVVVVAVDVVAISAKIIEFRISTVRYRH